jgi:hypothetical protein
MRAACYPDACGFWGKRYRERRRSAPWTRRAVPVRLWLCRFLLSNVGPEMPHRSDAGGEPLWRNGTYAADSRLPIARALRGFRPVPVTLVHGKSIVRTARAVLEPDHQIAQD